MAKKKKKSDKEKKLKKTTPKKKETPKKKKRPVGRPKKKGRPRKYYKSRKKKKLTPASRKGFGTNVSYNRVRALIWANYKEDFPSYREFISSRTDNKGNKIAGTSVVSLVFEQCKSIDCSDEDILSIYRQFRTQEKGETPILPADYYIQRPYYELLTVNLWDGMDERVWVVAPMLLNVPAYFLGILGESRCVDKKGEIKDITDCDANKGDKIVLGKKERFKAFVDYCNQFQQAEIYVTSEEVPHVKFIGRVEDEPQPYWNEQELRWEIELVPCTPFGDIDDYGFDPTVEVPIIPEEEELPELKPKKPEEKPPVKEIEKEIELEKVKQKTLELEAKKAEAEAKVFEKSAIADITSQWKAGKISLKEMKELIELIKS